MRFRLEDDFVLLRQVIANNPFQEYCHWAHVVDGLNRETRREFTVRGARERTDLLLTLFRNDMKSRLKRTATDEQYVEKEKLLQQVLDMEKEYSGRPRKVYKRPLTHQRRSISAQTDATSFVGAATTAVITSDPVCHVYETEPFPIEVTVSPAASPTEYIEGYSLAEGEPSISSGEETSEQMVNGVKEEHSNLRLELLERQADRDLLIKEKELQLEERRLKLDEDRLSFERTKFKEEMQIKIRRLDMEEVERRIRNDTEKMQLDLMKKMFDELVRKIPQ